MPAMLPAATLRAIVDARTGPTAQRSAAAWEAAAATGKGTPSTPALRAIVEVDTGPATARLEEFNARLKAAVAEERAREQQPKC